MKLRTLWERWRLHLALRIKTWSLEKKNDVLIKKKSVLPRGHQRPPERPQHPQPPIFSIAAKVQFIRHLWKAGDAEPAKRFWLKLVAYYLTTYSTNDINLNLWTRREGVIFPILLFSLRNWRPRRLRTSSILKVVPTPHFLDDLSTIWIGGNSNPTLQHLKTALSNSTRKWPNEASENRPRQTAAAYNFDNVQRRSYKSHGHPKR